MYLVLSAALVLTSQSIHTAAHWHTATVLLPLLLLLQVEGSACRTYLHSCCLAMLQLGLCIVVLAALHDMRRLLLQVEGV
jgi:hypothetical protein